MSAGQGGGRPTEVPLGYVGILTYVEDDNEAMCSPGRRTCSDICLVCYSLVYENIK